MDDGAPIRAIEPPQQVQERALPNAGRADYCHHLTGLDLQIEIAEHGDGRAADGVGLDEAPSFEKRHELRDVTKTRSTRSQSL